MKPELEDALRSTLGVAARRRELLDALGKAVDSGDDAAVRRAALLLLGRNDGETGDRAPASVERGAGRA